MTVRASGTASDGLPPGSVLPAADASSDGVSTLTSTAAEETARRPMPALARAGAPGRVSRGRRAVVDVTVPRLAVSPDEAARALGVSRDYLDEHVMPELRVIRKGRRRLVPLRELERWLSDNAHRAVDA